eukprot:1786805-Prymnesium_polylepis.1
MTRQVSSKIICAGAGPASHVSLVAYGFIGRLGAQQENKLLIIILGLLRGRGTFFRVPAH